VDGCAGGGKSASVTFVATTDPGGATGIYTWTFDDGTPPTITTVPTITHTYTTPGAKTVQVSLMLSATNCPPTTVSTTVSVPICPNGTGGGGFCGSLTYIIAVLLGLTLALGILIGALLCMGATVPLLLWGILVGLGIATAVAIATAYGLCAFHICPCLSSCDWLAIVWMVSLIGAITAAYLGGCCTPLNVVAVGLGAAALSLFAIWVSRCKPTACDISKHLLVALVSVAAVVLSYLVLFPVVAACGLSFVPAVVATLGAAAAVLVAATCH